MQYTVIHYNAIVYDAIRPIVMQDNVMRPIVMQYNVIRPIVMQ